MSTQTPSYTMEINNFSQRNAPIRSNLFRSYSCNWYVTVYPKGNGIYTHMSMYLDVANSPSMSQGWWRHAGFRFVIVNQSNVAKSERLATSHMFNERKPNRGFKKALPLTKLQEERFLVNDKLKIEVYVDVYNILGILDTHVLPEKKHKTVCVNGFQVLDSQVKSADIIFETHPETALYIYPQDPQLKTAYINILLRIYETLYNNPLEKITENELSNVSKGLLDLTQAGFKLEWLREKLEKVSVERKKLSGYEAQALELGKQLKNLELMMCNLKAEIKLKAES
ncbi:TRAF-like family protein [Raphanus sativus]|uniref:MATH domain and coiled-coil domain-containing protein At2g42465-like n=1 Tax=Raphanus sativus TaxID=3726 RepID=A0A6J0NG61_RAPSA|nr:MATH domain and coiled-coil domain-containing protein At2g42465-like [Raphanus sativus]KAJ4904106.1 TRAF-like family protein [Raphanus sativus]